MKTLLIAISLAAALSGCGSEDGGSTTTTWIPGNGKAGARLSPG